MKSTGKYNDKLRVEMGRFIRGCLVAASASFVYIIFGLWLRYLWDFDELYASFIATLLTIPVSFFGHSIVTFGVGLFDGPQTFRFIVSVIIAFATNWMVIGIGVQMVGVPYWLGLFLCTFVIPATNYLFLRFFVFARGLRDVAEKPERPDGNLPL